MNILLTGSSGLIGSALMKSLSIAGHNVTGLPRTYDDEVPQRGWDAVIHLAGENIATGRWTAEKKREIEQSRTEGTRRLVHLLAKADHKPAVFICASAIGIYGNRNNTFLDENSSPGEGFLAKVGKEWEAAARTPESTGIRTVQIRLGIVLSKKGGALQKMVPLFRLGLGGTIGSGRQYMSWICLTDVVHAVRFILQHEALSGAVNLVAPNPVTNAAFTTCLGRAMHRPTLLPVPAFAAKALLGEMAEELLLSSTRVLPKKLIDSGYNFCHPLLDSALNEIFKKR